MEQVSYEESGKHHVPVTSILGLIVCILIKIKVLVISEKHEIEIFAKCSQNCKKWICTFRVSLDFWKLHKVSGQITTMKHLAINLFAKSRRYSNYFDFVFIGIPKIWIFLEFVYCNICTKIKKNFARNERKKFTKMPKLKFSQPP